MTNPTQTTGSPLRDCPTGEGHKDNGKGECVECGAVRPPCEVGCSPKCTVCGRRKKPMGRDSMDNGLCSWECEGYGELPTACDLWPGEERNPKPEQDE